MTKQISLWIDHKKAVIVILTDKGKEIKQTSKADITLDVFIQKQCR